MGDIRLKKHPFEYGGKTYELSVNMNVLADLQELHDGDLNAVLLKGRTMKTVFEIAAAAMNDYADSKGWPEYFWNRGSDAATPMIKQEFEKIINEKLRERGLQ